MALGCGQDLPLEDDFCEPGRASAENLLIRIPLRRGYLGRLKMSIYANQVVLGAQRRSWFQSKAKQAQPLLEEIPRVGALIKALGTFYFSMVKDQIICIDDLERRSKTLDVKDVLGLISFLKEERRCKIVLLLNDGELDEESGKAFLAHFEKTVDIHVRFDATSEESAAIGVPLKDAWPKASGLTVSSFALQISESFRRSIACPVS